MDKGLASQATRDGCGVITLNHPEPLLNVDVELLSALKHAQTDNARHALILTGAGPGFCTGQDLSDGAFTPGEGVREHAPQIALKAVLGWIGDASVRCKQGITSTVRRGLQERVLERTCRAPAGGQLGCAQLQIKSLRSAAPARPSPRVRVLAMKCLAGPQRI